MTGATIVHRNARLKSYVDAVRYSEVGLPQKKITKQLTYNQYGQHQFDLEASLCEVDFSWLQDCYVGEIKSLELLEGLQDMQRLAGLFSYQTEKDGSVAATLAKSLTPAEEPTKAWGKVMHHVPRCSGSSLFAADLEGFQSRFLANLPSPTFQSVLGLSALLDREILDPQQEVNVKEDGVAHQLDGMEETLKKSKKGSRKLNKTEVKALCFNEDDAVAVRSGES
ncbi:hypothetical protein Ancab_002634, partial [Ancistrocladus abbreviatus]